MAVKRRKDLKGRVLKEGEFQRPNGTYEYRYRTKSRKRMSIYAPTLEELREKEIEVLRNTLDGLNVDSSKLTLNELFERWKELKRGLKDNTYKNYIYMYNQFARDMIGDYRITEIKKTDIRSFYNTLYDVRHLQVRTIECLHTVLHQVLEIAVEDEYIRSNPSDNALRELKKAHNGYIKKRKALTIEEQKVFIDFLLSSEKNIQWYPVFAVMLLTGLRVGEATGLRWCDVDFENNTISVNHTLVYYKRNEKGLDYAVNTPKTTKSNRTIPMLPDVKEALLMEKRRQEEIGISCNVRIDGYTDFIFINRYGGVQHQGTLNKALRRLIRDCNFKQFDSVNNIDKVVTIPPISCHILRHTFATRMCESNMNIKVISDILGHTEIKTTLNIYTSVTSEFKKLELGNFEQYMNTLAIGG